MHRLRDSLLALALAGLSSGLCAGEAAEARSDARDDVVAAQVRLLSASPDADAWVLAAWIAQSWCKGCGRVQANLLVERVLAEPPEDPGVLRVLIGLLPVFLASDPTRQAAEHAVLLAKLQSIDPQALAGWQLALPDSADPNRQAEGAAVLARAARSTRTGVDYYGSYRWIASRLVDLPLDPEAAAELGEGQPPEFTRQATALAMTHAIVAPSYLQLSRWCRDPSRSWAADCRAIARLLAGADTLLDRGIGRSMLERLATTEAERAEAARLSAAMAWLMSAGQCPALEEATILSVMEQEGVSEIGLIEAGLLARGLPIEPPKDPELHKQPCTEAKT